MASSSATRTRLQELPGRSNSIDPASFPAIPIIGCFIALRVRNAEVALARPAQTLTGPIGVLGVSHYEWGVVGEGRYETMQPGQRKQTSVP